MEGPLLWNRISIVGCPGTGKTTLAKHLSKALSLQHVELDRLYHQADWVPLETTEFLRTTRERTPSAGRWVVCGNYNGTVGNDLRTRADCVIFLDLPLLLTMKRVSKRTIGRVFTRKELWNGNRERLRNMFHPVPSENIILWALTQWSRYRRVYREKMTDGSWAHAEVLHLKTPAEVSNLVQRIPLP